MTSHTALTPVNEHLLERFYKVIIKPDSLEKLNALMLAALRIRQNAMIKGRNQ